MFLAVSIVRWQKLHLVDISRDDTFNISQSKVFSFRIQNVIFNNIETFNLTTWKQMKLDEPPWARRVKQKSYCFLYTFFRKYRIQNNDVE